MFSIARRGPKSTPIHSAILGSLEAEGRAPRTIPTPAKGGARVLENCPVVTPARRSPRRRRLGGVWGTHTPQPPQSRRTSKINGLQATAADRRRAAVSNRRTNNFNGLQTTAARLSDSILPLRRHNPTAPIASAAVFFHPDFSSGKEALHGRRKVPPIESLTVGALAENLGC